MRIGPDHLGAGLKFLSPHQNIARRYNIKPTISTSTYLRHLIPRKPLVQFKITILQGFGKKLQLSHASLQILRSRLLQVRHIVP